jgi:hypothetical protein
MTIGRTIPTLALVGMLSLTLSACGWFQGEDEAMTTTSTRTTTTTTAPPPAEPVQRQPTTMQPTAQTTTQEDYQRTLQK